MIEKGEVMKYKCLNCNSFFNEDKIKIRISYDKVEYWGIMVNMETTEWFCPYCGSDDIEEDYED